MESNSKLDYLLKALNISGTEISEKLKVDKTTVSKWRNNKRKLVYGSPLLKSLVQLLLSRQDEQEKNIIEQVLKVYKPEMDLQSREQKTEVLSEWLTEEKMELRIDTSKQTQMFSPKNGYNTNVSIFLGEKGVDEGIEYFIKYLLKIAPGQTMYLVDYSGINWTKGDESMEKQTRIASCMNLFRQLLDYGHKITIVDCDTDIYRPYRAIFRWMELYLSEGVEVWSHPPLCEEQYHYTTFILKGEISLQFVSNANSPSMHYGMLYKNNETIDLFSNSAETIIQKSKKLIETVPIAAVSDMIDIAAGHMKKKQKIYMLNPSLFLQSASESLLESILSENHVEKEKIEECILINRKIKKIQETRDCISIHDLDVVEKNGHLNGFLDMNLSVICKKKIVVSKKSWKAMIEEIIRKDDGEHISNIFTSFGYLNNILANLSILVQEDNFIAAWDVQKYKKRMYCVHPDVISGFYRYIDDIWYMIPKVCKSKDWRNKQLSRFIEE